MTEVPLTPTSEFLNVDLSIRSRRSLAPLLREWPDAQTPGRKAGRSPLWIHTSGMSFRRTADQVARELIAAVDALPAGARKCWVQASSRVFDVGVQAGMSPHNFEEVRLSEGVIRDMARLKITLLITVYAPRHD